MLDPPVAMAKILMLLLLEAEAINREQYEQIEKRLSSFWGKRFKDILRDLGSEVLGHEESSPK